MANAEIYIVKLSEKSEGRRPSEEREGPVVAIEMNVVEFWLRKRYWAPICLRSNIARPEDIEI